LIEQYCPIVDNVTLIECLANGWVSPYKEYQVIIKVDDIETYKNYDKEFQEHFAFFNFSWDLVNSCIGVNGHLGCNNLRNERCPNGSEQQRKDMFKAIKMHAAGFMRCLTARKQFINNHQKKIELTRKIIEARPFSKIITFSNNIKMAESIGGGKVYSGKDSKKKGRTTIEAFNAETVGVLHTIKKCNEGLTVKGLSVAVILGLDSSAISAKQRLGRVIRAEEGKQAEIFNLVIEDTVEINWFNKSHVDQSFITIDEAGLMDVLEGKEPKPYVKPLKQFQFRF
jgi:superfamily II DNA or RNA helicase